MMLPHLDLPLTDVTWHVNVTFGVGAINVHDELALRKQGRLYDTSTVSTRHTGVHRIDGQFKNYNARLYYHMPIVHFKPTTTTY